MSIIGGSGSEKTKGLLNLINEQEEDNDELIDKIYLYSEEVNETKYQFLIKKREDAGIKYFNDPKAFIDNIHSIWMMFTIILMIIIQTEKQKI